MKHTATPLKLLPGTYENKYKVKIVPTNHLDSRYIMVDGENKEEFAEFIVKACNNHDELVGAARLVINTANKIQSELGPEPPSIIVLRRALANVIEGGSK